MSDLPHFIIGGAPKCGTTSVYEWLKLHPEVCVSSVKETGFLLDNKESAAPNIHRDGLEAYGQYFRHKRPGQILLEASPQYIHQTTPLEVIPTLATQPKVLFIVREPAKRVYSSFRFEKFSQHTVPQDMSFEEYLQTERGKFVVQMTRYASYLRRWKETLPEAQLKVWVFEHMIADPRTYMTELTDWLGIDSQIWQGFDFSAKNETRNIGNMALHKRAVAWRGILPHSLVQAIKPLYYRLNGRPMPVKQETEDKMILKLKGEFRADNQELADLMGLDLGPWGMKTPSQVG